ncbi:MAG: hypothetical protein AB1749_00330 [Pseudomonadota bacterium]
MKASTDVAAGHARRPARGLRVVARCRNECRCPALLGHPRSHSLGRMSLRLGRGPLRGHDPIAFASVAVSELRTQHARFRRALPCSGIVSPECRRLYFSLSAGLEAAVQQVVAGDALRQFVGALAAATAL